MRERGSGRGNDIVGLFVLSDNHMQLHVYMHIYTYIHMYMHPESAQFCIYRDVHI